MVSIPIRLSTKKQCPQGTANKLYITACGQTCLQSVVATSSKCCQSQSASQQKTPAHQATTNKHPQQKRHYTTQDGHYESIARTTKPTAAKYDQPQHDQRFVTTTASTAAHLSTTTATKGSTFDDGQRGTTVLSSTATA